MSDATRMEVKRYGIDVVIVEPGGVYSDWGRTAAKHVCKAVTSRHTKTRYAFGIGNASMRFLHTILPARWFDGLILFLFNHFGKQSLLMNHITECL
ncbi:MAG: hypothetical protein KBT20_08415 [Bacteroidales bacterium]|nr:hypothetical protein [Candidatus Liminaster caballi]